MAIYSAPNLQYCNAAVFRVPGLFKQGISQSGCVLNPWVLYEHPLQKAKKVANLVGCPDNDNKLMIDCLRKKPARQIVHTVKQFQVITTIIIKHIFTVYIYILAIFIQSVFSIWSSCGYVGKRSFTTRASIYIT